MAAVDLDTPASPGSAEALKKVVATAKDKLKAPNAAELAVIATAAGITGDFVPVSDVHGLLAPLCEAACTGCTSQPTQGAKPVPEAAKVSLALGSLLLLAAQSPASHHLAARLASVRISAPAASVSLLFSTLAPFFAAADKLPSHRAMQAAAAAVGVFVPHGRDWTSQLCCRIASYAVRALVLRALDDLDQADVLAAYFPLLEATATACVASECPPLSVCAAVQSLFARAALLLARPAVAATAATAATRGLCFLPPTGTVSVPVPLKGKGRSTPAPDSPAGEPSPAFLAAIDLAATARLLAGTDLPACSFDDARVAAAAISTAGPRGVLQAATRAVLLLKEDLTSVCGDGDGEAEDALLPDDAAGASSTGIASEDLPGLFRRASVVLPPADLRSRQCLTVQIATDAILRTAEAPAVFQLALTALSLVLAAPPPSLTSDPALAHGRFQALAAFAKAAGDAFLAITLAHDQVVEAARVRHVSPPAPVACVAAAAAPLWYALVAVAGTVEAATTLFDAGTQPPADLAAQISASLASPTIQSAFVNLLSTLNRTFSPSLLGGRHRAVRVPAPAVACLSAIATLALGCQLPYLGLRGAADILAACAAARETSLLLGCSLPDALLFPPTPPPFVPVAAPTPSPLAEQRAGSVASSDLRAASAIEPTESAADRTSLAQNLTAYSELILAAGARSDSNLLSPCSTGASLFPPLRG
jgi:hypothetical protein